MLRYKFIKFLVSVRICYSYFRFKVNLGLLNLSPSSWGVVAAAIHVSHVYGSKMQGWCVFDMSPIIKKKLVHKFAELYLCIDIL